VSLYGLGWERLGDERKLLGGEVCFHSLRHYGCLLGFKKEVEGVDLAVPYWPRKMGREPKHIGASQINIFFAILQDSDEFLPNYGLFRFLVKDGLVNIGIAFFK
jgi:hypothetical protein